MSLHIEIQSARPAWLSLSIPERIDYLDRVGYGLQSLLDGGVKLIGFVLNEPSAPDRADYHYLAVWYMPEGRSQIQVLESVLAQAGWDEYFEPVEG